MRLDKLHGYHTVYTLFVGSISSSRHVTDSYLLQKFRLFLGQCIVETNTKLYFKTNNGRKKKHKRTLYTLVEQLVGNVLKFKQLKQIGINIYCSIRK